MSHIAHRTADVDGLKVFYREAGRRDAPVLLLLHGFPTSSHMFRDLIPALSDRYHVIAPDLPGFGFTEAPDRASSPYTFAYLAKVVDRFTEVRGRLRALTGSGPDLLIASLRSPPLVSIPGIGRSATVVLPAS